MSRPNLVVVDTGLSDASMNITYDRLWLVHHARGEVGNVLRFYRSKPGVWLGLHQMSETEVNLSYCSDNRIPVVRRLTGGKTLYVDHQQLGWSMILKRNSKLAALDTAGLLERCCQALTNVLSEHVYFKAPNDLEIGGRKLASIFITRFKNSYLIQGTLIIKADIDRMTGALLLPTEPRRNGKMAGAHERVTGLQDNLKRSLNLKKLQSSIATSLANEFTYALRTPSKAVYARFRQFDTKVEVPAVLERPVVIDTTGGTAAESFWPTPGGLLRAELEIDLEHGWLQRLKLAGDVVCEPLDLFDQISSHLIHRPLDEIEQTLRDLCAKLNHQLLGFTVDDLWHVIHMALERIDQCRELGLSLSQSNRLTVLGQPDATTASELIMQAEYLMVLYCVKHADCAWRDEDCRECGMCSVGTSYALARQYGLQPVTVNGHDHLSELLAEMASKGVRAVIGMCCQAFFMKHSQLFFDAGIAMLLLDIDGNTCYTRGQEEQGYLGRFPCQLQINMSVLEGVLKVRPVDDAAAVLPTTNSSLSK